MTAQRTRTLGIAAITASFSFSVVAGCGGAVVDDESESEFEAEGPPQVPTCDLCDGQCTDLSSDPDNCGACGVVVGEGTCKNGHPVCATWASPCGGTTCIDLMTSPAHCGACNHPVPEGFVCSNGQSACASGADCGA